MALNRSSGCGGKGSSSEAGTWLSVGWWCQLGNPENLAVGGPSHSVPLKLMPQVVLRAGCMFNPALLHSRVVGPWGSPCIGLVTPLSGSHLSGTYLEVEWLYGGCERWLTALGNHSWHVKWMLSAEGYFTIRSNYWPRVGLISCFTGNLGLHSRKGAISNSDSSCSHLIYSIILQRAQDNNFQGQYISIAWDRQKERKQFNLFVRG